MDAKPVLSLKFSLASLAMGVGALVVMITALIICAVVNSVNQTVVSQSVVYRLARRQIAASAHVTLAAGPPVSIEPPERILVFTNLAEFGQANFVIPVSGSRRSGNASVIAEKRSGVWVFTQLTVTLEGHPTPINLLSAPP
jgi:hypothetical protein